MNEQGYYCFGDALDELCAYYMLCGCPCSEFWNGDYTLLKNYVRQHELAVEQRNQELWLQGFYIYEAFAVVMQNAFGRKGATKAEYPKEPHRITPLTDHEKEMEKRKKVEEFRSQLMALDRKFSARKKQGGG